MEVPKMSDTDKTGAIAGLEKMIEGYCLRVSGKDGPQIVQCGEVSWNDKKADIFLDALGASCNVTYAIAQCGMSKSTLYYRRRTDPGFAAQWQAALEQGYVRVEMLMLDLAENSLSGKAPDPDCPIPPMTVKEAMNLLQLHRGAVHKDGNRRKKWNARPRELEDVRESILARLEAIAHLPDDECDGDGAQ
jgi:hypothetical protein